MARFERVGVRQVQEGFSSGNSIAQHQKQGKSILVETSETCSSSCLYARPLGSGNFG